MLAIVISYYKLAFFEATLQSLVDQTDQRFRVYIGDDASPEDPKILLKQFKEKFNFVYHRFEKNLGEVSLVKQWERCLKLTSNEVWLIILGDDDILGKNVVASFYSNFTEFETKVNVVRFSTQKINEKGEALSHVYKHPVFENSSEILFRDTRSSLSEYAFSLKSLKTYNFRNLPLAWSADLLAVLEISNFKIIYTINEATVYVRVSPISISGNKSLYKLKNEALFRFYQILLKEYRHLFSKERIAILELNWHKTYFNDKFKIKHLVIVLKYYIRRLSFTKLIMFLKNAIGSVQLNK